MTDSKKLARAALLSSLAIICGYIESLIPASYMFPGIKLGISNAVILFALYMLDTGTAFFVMLIKVAVSAILFSGLNVLFYSFMGGLFSLSVMALLKKLDFSPITSGMLGGAFHNIGQLAAASVMLKTLSVFCYLPPLILFGAAFGIATGSVCKIIMERLKKI